MNRKAVMFGLLTVLIWGSGFAAIRASLLGGFSAQHLLVFRFLIASLVFVIYALLPGVKLRLPKKEHLLPIALLGIFGITIYQLGVTFGQETVSAGAASMIVAASPLFTALLAIFALKEPMNRLGWISLFVGFIGVVLIMLGAEGASMEISLGAIYILIAAIATSIFYVYQKPLFQTYRPIELTAYFTWAGTIPFLIFLPGLGDTLQASTNEAFWSAIYLGIFPAAAAYVLWAYALSLSDAGAISSILYFEPVVAIIVAWVWLQEIPTILSVIGGAIAVSSVVIMQWANRRTRPPLASKK